MQSNNNADRTSSINSFIAETNLSPTKQGSLNGLTFAVKDCIDIQNLKTSCGNPTWLTNQSPAITHATCVETLLADGATCLGKTVLGEFNSGSTGVNHFFGMPINPKYPQRVPGGSSSGSAAVVAAGLVDFSLGTDAAGSVRIPASFCEIYGIRPSYGSISMTGVQSFSPSFDTVGIFARDLDVLTRVFSSLSISNLRDESHSEFVYVIDELMLLLPIDQRKFVYQFISESCEVLNIKPTTIKLSDIHPLAGNANQGIGAILRKLFCAEIWESLGKWIKEHNLQFQKTTYVDFSYMENISKTDLSQERELFQIYSSALKKLLNNNSLIFIPTTPSIASLRVNNYSKVNEFDYDKLRPLISIASVGGLPQINIPTKGSDSPFVGVSLIAGHGNDLFLINSCSMIQTK